MLSPDLIGEFTRAATSPKADLAGAALVIARLEYPHLDPSTYLERLDAMGADATERLERVPAGRDPLGPVVALNRYLFDEQGFVGNMAHYDDLRNSFLNKVLDRRTGIPITRIMAANEARSLGYGACPSCTVPAACSRNAIARGIEEITDGSSPGVGRIRRAAAGRRPITARDPHLLAALDRLIDPDTRGDPKSPLRWICKSTRTLAAQLTKQHHPISHVKLAALLPGSD